MRPTICIIKALNKDGERHCGIESKDWTVDFLSHYNIIENIGDFVQFLKLSTIYELFTTINVLINPKDIHIVNIEDLYYTSDYVYQAIFKSVSKDTNCYSSLVNESNKLATQMLGERNIVDGDMIIIKRSITSCDFKYCDITCDDITEILQSQILHTAIIIENDGTITEQKYTYSPLEINFGQSHIDNVRYHEFKYLDFRLFFHVDTKAERTNINTFASEIYGQNIYGNVLISLSDNSDSSPVNLNLTKDILNQIHTVILYHIHNKSEIDRKKYRRNLEIKNKDFDDYDPSKHITFEHEGFPEITLCPNFFQIIKLEYDNIKEKVFDKSYKFENVLNDIS